MDLIFVLFLIILAFFCEFIDSSLGGGYGTILTPVLLMFNLDIFYIVPAILFSEILTGLSGSVSHHFFGNIDFSSRTIINRRIVYLIGILGILAGIFSVYIVLQLNKLIIKTYIGILVISLGFLMIKAKKFTFSWKKMGIVGGLASFNKVVSGGGFGPLVTMGQVVSGRSIKNSIGVALACEIPVCLTGLIMYTLLNGWIDFSLPLLLSIGAIPATIIGAFTTKKINNEKTIKRLVGFLAIFLGSFTLIKVFF